MKYFAMCVVLAGLFAVSAIADQPEARPAATDCRTADLSGGYIVIGFATLNGATVYLNSLPPSQQESAYLLSVKGSQQWPKFLAVVSTCDASATAQEAKRPAPPTSER